MRLIGDSPKKWIGWKRSRRSQNLSWQDLDAGIPSASIELFLEDFTFHVSYFAREGKIYTFLNIEDETLNF